MRTKKEYRKNLKEFESLLHHHGITKVPIRGFSQIYDMALQALPGNPPSYFKDHREAKIRIFKDM